MNKQLDLTVWYPARGVISVYEKPIRDVEGRGGTLQNAVARYFENAKIPFNSINNAEMNPTDTFKAVVSYEA